MSASFDNANLSYSVIEDGVKTWVGTTSITTALLWIVGPPLLLWLVWLIVRERPNTERRAIAGGVTAPGALPEGSAPAEEWRVRRRRSRISRARSRDDPESLTRCGP